MIEVRIVPASPFARKCRIAAAHLGLLDRVKFVDAHDDPDDRLRTRNPLNKIPLALLEDGTVLFDSAVIVDFLDHLAGGGKIIPREAGARYRTLTLEALSDGIMDASVLIVYEGRYRESHQHSPRWIEMQQAKIDTALAHLEGSPPAKAGDGAIDAGQISLACALGFLDLRLGGAWRAGHPALVAWLDGFAARVPSFEATRAPR